MSYHQINREFRTHEPSVKEKMAQMYGLVPKSWLLDVFKVENGSLFVSTKGGQVISAPIDELKIRIQTDKYDRKEVYVRHGKEKLHFKEISGMLSDNEWEDLFGVISTFPNVKGTVLGKIVKILAIILAVGGMLAKLYIEYLKS